MFAKPPALQMFAPHRVKSIVSQGETNPFVASWQTCKPLVYRFSFPIRLSRNRLNRMTVAKSRRGFSLLSNFDVDASQRIFVQHRSLKRHCDYVHRNLGRDYSQYCPRRRLSNANVRIHDLLRPVHPLFCHPFHSLKRDGLSIGCCSSGVRVILRRKWRSVPITSKS